jgi:hypothetical protein
MPLAKTTKSNNTFTGSRKLSKKTNKTPIKKDKTKNKNGSTTEEMLDILSTDSNQKKFKGINRNQPMQNMPQSMNYQQPMQNMPQPMQFTGEIDPLMISNFVSTNAHGQISNINKIGELFGPTQIGNQVMSTDSTMQNPLIYQQNELSQQLMNQNMQSFNQPMSQFNQPMSQFNQPMSQFNQPMSQPMSQFNEPMSQFNEPTSQFTQPMSQFNQPMSQFNQPMSQFNQPMSQPMSQYNEQINQLNSNNSPQQQNFMGQSLSENITGSDGLINNIKNLSGLYKVPKLI